MAKTASTWMPFYVGDYLADTQRLTCEQHGAYLLLMLDYWKNGPPPDDDDVLRQIVRLDRLVWKRHRPTLERMFQVQEGVWSHRRIDHERSRADGMVEQRKAAGVASAAKRALERESNERSTSVEIPLPRNRRPSPSPSHEANASDDANASSASASKQALAKIVFSLPADIPADAWAGYEEMRKRKRAPMTDRARTAILAKLRVLADAGHPPGEVLDQSTEEAWTSVYPIKENRNGTSKFHRTDDDNSTGHGVTVRAGLDFLADIEGRPRS